MSNYQKLSSKIQQLTINNPRTNYKIDWVNIVEAGKKEIEYLRKQYNFDMHHLNASSCNTFAQRPMIEDAGKYVFLIFHFPVLTDGEIISGEIEFFIGHQYLISLHNNNIPAMADFFNTAKKDQTSLLAYESESSAMLLVDILEKLISSTYDLLDENSKEIHEVEEVIFAQKQKEAVSQILNLRHNIINIRKILQNHKNILKKLTELKSSLVDSQKIKENYERLVEHSKRIWEILENQKEIIEALNSTNESMLNSMLSKIMKTLTIFSVIVFPLTLLAAIFGMNAINMPFVNEKYGFWYIIAIMLIGCGFMLIWFRHKKWL
ncbi:MAG: magnesium transporter CorA family protein [bacterium]